MYNYSYSNPFFDNSTPTSSEPFGGTNFSLHSVHLSPEELAAIDHGLMSVYGKREREEDNYKEKENNFLSNQGKNYGNGNGNGIFNTPASTNYIKNQNNVNVNPYNTPTPTPVFDNNKASSLFQNSSTPKEQNSRIFTRPEDQPQRPPPQMSYPYTQPQPYPNPPSTTNNINNYDNLMKTYEERIESILRHEREKYEKMEINYRQQLEQLKRNEFGYSEKLKLEQIIQDLRGQIEDLEGQILESRKYNNFEKVEALKLHYDRKISNLVGQFEQEKASALEIMKTRAKAEINLIIPKLKLQLQKNLERNQLELVNKIKGQANSHVQKLKQDFQMERQVLIDHLRKKHFEEIKQIKTQFQLKFESKLIEEKQKLFTEREKERNGYGNGNPFNNNSNGYRYPSNSNGFHPYNTNTHLNNPAPPSAKNTNRFDWFDNNTFNEPSFLL